MNNDITTRQFLNADAQGKLAEALAQNATQLRRVFRPTFQIEHDYRRAEEAYRIALDVWNQSEDRVVWNASHQGDYDPFGPDADEPFPPLYQTVMALEGNRDKLAVELRERRAEERRNDDPHAGETL